MISDNMRTEPSGCGIFSSNTHILTSSAKYFFASPDRIFSPMILAAVEPQFPLPTMHTVLLFSDDKRGFFDFVVVDFFVVTAFAMAFLVVAFFVVVVIANASR